ncbi:hypothetical protein HPB51_023597 [Rhipicephalus microplus]|uniref:Uncharacterized protein n=1 Tax=Rhipicephalus microplus TaxID=6941 RepID=A0A9J6ECF4_RHIMP|nr:hypothetical protein HPB51_023597 [Rhipicephalus microplus]
MLAGPGSCFLATWRRSHIQNMVSGAPPSSHQEEVEPYRRYLTAFTDTEEDARLMLRRRSRYSPDRKQRDAELNKRANEEHFSALRRESQSPPRHKTPDDEGVAARVIQRWVRTKFQPWMAVRRILRSPDLAANCTDRDAGAVEVTLVDHDFMSAIEQLSEHPLVEVEMAPDAPRLDLDVDGTSSHGFPRRRGAATMSSSHIFPKRSHSDGRVLEETSPGENARRNLELLYDGVTGALASIKLQRLIDDVTYILLQKGKTQLLELTVTLLVLSGVLWMLLRMGAVAALSGVSVILTGREKGDRFRGCDPERRSSASRHGVANDAIAKHWVRTNFQPWLAARKGSISRPPNPVDPWTDRDTGAVAVTLVDHDSMSVIEQPGESSLVDVQLDGLGTTTDVRLRSSAFSSGLPQRPRWRRKKRAYLLPENRL